MENDGAKEKFIDIEKMSLPKGGGAYSGLGESLSINGFTGEAQFTLPIYASPCRNSEPQLALTYSATGGQGIFGMGFSLNLPVVSRNTEKHIPTYDDSKDVFLSSVMGELVPKENRIDSYLLRNEGAFAQIEYHQNESYWKIIDRNNATAIYGKNGAKRVDPNNPSRVFSWYISESTDCKGNRIEYKYNSEGHIEEISYGFDSSQKEPCFTLRFSYAPREDCIYRYNSGFLIETRCLCVKIEMIHRFDGKAQTVRETNFIYETYGCTTLLKKVQTIAGNAALPEACFDYSRFEAEKVTTGILKTENEIPFTLGADGFALADLYGDGMPGLLFAHDKSVLYCEPLGGGKYGVPQSLSEFPIDRDISGSKATFASINGNGKYELVVHSPVRHGFYEHTDGVWSGFKPFENYANDFQGPYIESADLQGDRLSHICVAAKDNLRYYPSLKKKGVGKPVITKLPDDFPEATKNSPKELVAFLDIFGDGLQHRVRVRNGSVDCWPNLGYGKFGEKISFQNAPDFGEGFDTSRLFFADIDGSGCVDIVYAHFDHVDIYFNNSRKFSEKPLEISLPDSFTSIDKISFADINGCGASCLILSKHGNPAKHYYLDFTLGQKPYMLIAIDNQMGRKVELSYLASTAFLLEDKKRWAFKPPFPVQLVAEKKDYDLVSSHVVTTNYRYKEGYYDFEENAFRGFAVVEEKTTESVESCDYERVALKKSFYHAGKRNERLKTYFWDEDKKAMPIEEPFIEATDIEQAEKALRGRIMREEIYGADSNPYTVTHHNYSVKELQPPQNEHYGSYLVYGRQDISYAYECNPNDPVVSHNFILDIDEFGNPLKTCKINYPRRNGEYAMQAVVESHSFANVVDEVRYIGIPVETKIFELRGLVCKDYFDFGSLKSQIEGAQANLMQWTREYYWDNALSKALPLGEIGSVPLLHRHEEAAFPCDFPAISGIFSEGQIKDDGGYISSDGYWWKTAGTYFYFDKNQFFLPWKEENSCSKTCTSYDSHCLMPVELTRYLGGNANIAVKAEIDYNALQYSKITDANGNVSCALYDPLGQIIVSTFYGNTEGQSEGFGKLEDYKTLQGSFEDIISNPQKYIQNAASYFYYDLSSWQEQNQPVRSISLASDNFVSEERKIHISIVYADGFGRKAEEKFKYEDKWAVKGRVVLSSDEKELLAYQPFFSETPIYQHEGFDMPPVINRYDPIGRLVSVESPKGLGKENNYGYLASKTEHGLWEQKMYGHNNCLKESDYYKKFKEAFPLPSTTDQKDRQDAIDKGLAFDGMFKTLVFDNRGNKVKEFIAKDCAAYYEYDALGRLAAIADERLYSKGLRNIKYIYDMTANILCSESCDAGRSYELKNIFGNTVCSVTPKGDRLKTVYDALMRPVKVELNGICIEKIEYGENAKDSKDKNLNGQICRHYDQGGVEEFEAYNISGTVLRKSRKLAETYDGCINWDESVSLSDEKFCEEYSYNALSAIISHKAPDGQTYRYQYDDLGQVKSIKSEQQSILNDIHYNASGLRTGVEYGNGVCSNYAYDAYSLGLERAVTAGISDLHYTLDADGNMSRIRDVLGDTQYSNSNEIEPIFDYIYDAESRLVKATGRICAGDGRDFQNLEQYTQQYAYDFGGNMTMLKQISLKHSYTMNMVIDESSNRMIEARTGEAVEGFQYDARGNMVSMPNLREMAYNALGQLARAVIVKRENGEDDAEYYNYDSAGKRIRKVSRRMVSDGCWEVTEKIYLGGFGAKRIVIKDEEILCRTSMRIVTGESAAATVYNWTKDDRQRETKILNAPKTIFQLDNHINSVVIELNEKAEILTKEEYFPFGGTALLWGSEIDVNLKEYRFAGKEKDAAGLYYFETRYYACVYGRMVSADSAAYIKPENPASLNLYAYCGNEPVSNIDPTGHCREPSKTFIFAGADQIFRAKMAYASKPNTFVRQIYHKTEPPSRKIEDKFLPSWSSMQSDENSTVIIWQHGNPESIQGVKYRQMDKTKQASELILFSCRTANKMENLGEKNIAEEMLDAFPNVLRVVGSRGVHKGHYAAGGMSQGRKFLASIGHQAKKCFVVYSRNERGETIETQLKEGKVYDLFSLRNAVRGIPSYSRAALPPPNQAA